MFKKNLFTKKELFIFISIIGVASFMRLYRISEYMRFLGDEGRDVLVVKGILEGNFTLLGPTSSVGGFFLGPIYYYFMAPFLYLFNYDPVGPAVMIALFGVATVALLYALTRQFFGKRAAVIAALSYAIAPTIVDYSRSSWNPNPVPFFALLTTYLLYKALMQNQKWLFVLCGILFGIMMQLHYVVTFYGLAVSVIIATFTVIKQKDNKKNIHLLVPIFSKYLLFLIGFIIGWSPFLAFEVRHNFINLRLMYEFIFMSKDTGATTQSIFNVWYVLLDLFGNLLIHFPANELHAKFIKNNSIQFYFYYFAASIVVVTLVTFLIRNLLITYKSGKKISYWYLLLLLWLFISILPFSIYKKQIYIYYLAFLFPIPFMLIGNFLSKGHNLLIAGSLAILIFININGAIFWHTPNDQLGQTKRISQAVFDQAQGKPFNFALITDGNSDHAYRYFFDLWGNPPLIIENSVVDPERKTVTDQLFVVCESLPCEPLGNHLWEIAGFGRSEIQGKLYVRPYEVYKLIHYTEEK